MNYFQRRKLKIIILVSLISLFIIGGLGYGLYTYFHQEEILRDEIEVLVNVELSSGSIDTDIKTWGSYAKVEEAIKNYVLEFQTYYQEMLDINNDDDLYLLLDSNNLENDGPNFKTSLSYITSNVKTLRTDFNNISDMCEEDTIMEYIDDLELDTKYISLYKELMMGDIYDKMGRIRDYVSSMKEYIISVTDIEKDVLHLLKDNSDDWYIDNDSIYFTSSKLEDAYNEYLKELESVGDESD